MAKGLSWYKSVLLAFVMGNTILLMLIIKWEYF